MHFKCTDGRDHHHRIRDESRRAAFDIKKLFGAEVCTEPSLGHGIIAEPHGSRGSDDRITSVRDICKGSAVNERGRSLKRLHEIRLYRVTKQSGHGSRCAEVARRDRLIIVGIAYHHARETLAQIGKRRGKAENRHHLGGDGDVKAVLARDAVFDAAETVHHKAELTVIHIHTSAPRDAARIDAQRIAVMYVIVYHCGKQIVCRAYGMKITGKMQIYILHRDHLRIPAARGAALYAEHGSERRLAERGDSSFTYPAKTVGKPYRGGGLALSGRRGIDSGHKHQLSVTAPRILPYRGSYLRLISSVRLDVFVTYTERGSHLAYRLYCASLRYLYIRHHRNHFHY